MIHTLNGPEERWYSGVYGGSRSVRDIEAVGIAKADIIFTVGTNMVEEVKKVGALHGIPIEDIEKKLYPIHHGVDTKTYGPMPNVQKEYDIIFIGRFAPVKGVMELLDAVEMLKSRYPEIKIRLIGGGSLKKTSKTGSKGIGWMGMFLYPHDGFRPRKRQLRSTRHG